MNDETNNAYGLQVLFDGYGAHPELCADVAHLYRFLMELPARIGMHRVGFPHVIQISEAGIMGLSGFVFIMESHISVHTYEERGFVTADVYSCKMFDDTAVIDYLKNAFAVTSVESKVVLRGQKFHELPTSLQLCPLPDTQLNSA